MNPSAAPRAFVADASYVELKDHVIEATGLAFYLDKDADFVERVGRRLSALGLREFSAYLDLLRRGPAGEAELDELIAELTIGETYFFRHPEQFEALRQVVLPDIIERNRARRRIRVWSAGSSTGAEAYSVAILLAREFGARLAGWEISILGTDINRQFLAQAGEALFGDWALRQLPEELRGSCFSRSPRGWALAESYRKGVSFQYHNLVRHPFPSLVCNLAAFDLVLCRNVMIYFSSEVIASLVGRLRDSLVEEGWLLVGYAESNPQLFRNFRTFSVPGAIFFQRSDKPSAAGAFPDFEAKAALPPAPPVWSPPSLPELPTLLKAYEAAPEAGRAEAAADDPVARIIEEANRGRWEAAEKLCEGLLETDKMNPLVPYYYALVVEQKGRPQQAENLLRRSLYLKRGFILAHYHLGLLLNKRGDRGGAARSFRNSMRLLEETDPGRRFPEADGISAADLSELVSMQLAVLEAP